MHLAIQMALILTRHLYNNYIAPYNNAYSARVQELNSLAQDRRRRKLITRQAMDTNGCPMVPEEDSAQVWHMLMRNHTVLPAILLLPLPHPHNTTVLWLVPVLIPHPTARSIP